MNIRNALLGVAVLACLIAFTTSATSGARSPVAMPATKNIHKSYVAKRAAVGLVPVKQTELFGLLERQPATASVPAIVERQANGESPTLAGLGLDTTQARAATIGSDTFYLVPGSDGLCLFLKSGVAACQADLKRAADEGLQLSIVPAPTGPLKPGQSPIGPGTVTMYGFAPDGVTGVVGTTATGKTVDATQAGNAYMMTAGEPIVHVTLLR